MIKLVSAALCFSATWDVFATFWMPNLPVANTRFALAMAEFFAAVGFFLIAQRDK